MWREVVHAMQSFLQADLAAVSMKNDRGVYEIVEWQCTKALDRQSWNDLFSSFLSMCYPPEEVAVEYKKSIDQVFETGFLFNRTMDTPEKLTCVFLPINQENRTTAVLLLGWKREEAFTKSELNLYLAVVGLVGSTAARIQFEQELEIHRRRLEELVKERTEELEKEVALRKENEKTIRILLKEVHHRIKNNMTMIKSILAIQGESTDEPIAKGVLKAAENRIMSMMLLYDKLYRKEISGTVSLQEYLEILIHEIVGTYQKPVEVGLDIENVPVAVKIAAPLGIIVNECISNAMKHAFTRERKNELDISATLSGEDEVQLIIHDNGNASPFGNGGGNKGLMGFGMELVDLLTEQLKGHFFIQEDNGTKCVIQFPLSSIAGDP